MKLLFTYLLVFISLIGVSQKLKIVNSITHEPIPGVIVSDSMKVKYSISDSDGKIDIEPFLAYKYIIIQHNYYEAITISPDSIKKLNYTIELNEISFQLSGFVVMANKWEQKKTEIPISISEVESRKVKLLNPQTAADMLSSTGKIFIQKSQLGGGSPMIRGFSANSVLIVVDGVRMNNAIFRSGNLQNSLNIDPNSLGHTEVIFGPGSVTYGSDALGGVMDFHTKDVQFSNDNKFSANADGFYRMSSATAEQTASIGFDLKWEKFGSHTQLLRSSFSNLKAGKNHFGNYPDFGKRYFVAAQSPTQTDTMIPVEDSNIMVPSYFTMWNLNQKFRYQPNNKFDITYSLIYSTTTDIPRYDRLTQMDGSTLKYADWHYGPQTWSMNNLRLRLFQPSKIYDSGNIIIAYQYFEESRNDRKFNSPDFRHRTEKVNLYTANIDFSKKLSTKTNLYYGFDAAFNDVRSTAYSENIFTDEVESIQTRYPDKLNHYFSSGIFFNLKHQITPKIHMLAGFRYSITSLNSEFDTTFNQLPYQEIQLFNHAPNGSIGFAWMAMKDLQLNLNAATGFRAPNLDDVAKVFDSEPGSVVVPNPNLNPEYVYSGEIGLIKSFKKIAKIELTAYASYINNLIVRKDYTYNGVDSVLYDGTMSRVQAMQNADNAQIFGGILKFSIKISKNLDFSSTYNIAKGIDSDNNSLRHIPPNFGNTNLSFKNSFLTASLYANYSQNISFNNLAPSEQAKVNIYTPDGAEAWYTLNFIADFKVYKRIHINFAVDNILDRFYIPYSSGIPAAGRNIMIGLRIFPY